MSLIGLHPRTLPRGIATLWTICLIAALATASRQALAQSGAAPAAAAGCPGAYVIGAEDVLEIAVWNNTTITRTVPVRPDGRISLPLVDDVVAAGLTTSQLQENLLRALTVYIPKPSVTVIVREIHSFKVTVIGEVNAPGRYVLKDPATVLDLLAMAGGFTPFAAHGRIVVLRQEGTTKRIPFSYGRTASGKEGSDNFCVRPGDIIVVP